MGAIRRDTFEDGSPQETLSAAASGVTTWIQRGSGEGTLLHVTCDNTDVAGTITVEAVNDKDALAYTIPFEDENGIVATELAVVAGTDVSEPFEIPAGLKYLRVRYARTSGGTSQSIVVDAAAIKVRG